jgi:hypothetical protein
MKKYLLVPILASVLSLSFIGPANAEATVINSVKWTKNPINVLSVDPERTKLDVGLRISLTDADGVCSGYVRISKPSNKESSFFADLTIKSGSSESAVWAATVTGLYSTYKGTWIVSGIYLTDCGGRITKFENMKAGIGGATGKLVVTTGDIGYAKIATPKVLNLAWKEIVNEEEEEWEQIPFKFTIRVKDAAGKNLAGAPVRLTVCVDTYSESGETFIEEDLLKCSYVGLGKTNNSGSLTKSIYISQIIENGKKPLWADKTLTMDEYWSDSYGVKWRAYLSVLKTKKTSYTEYSKTINLYDSTTDGRCLKAGC